MTAGHEDSAWSTAAASKRAFHRSSEVIVRGRAASSVAHLSSSPGLATAIGNARHEDSRQSIARRLSKDRPPGVQARLQCRLDRSGAAIMRMLHRILLLLSLLSLPGWAYAIRLHDGDLLFVTAAHSGLSGAIADATAAGQGPNFDHVGIVAHEGELQVVLHADEQGSRQQPLADFVDDASAKNRAIYVYRLKRHYHGAIPEAIARARLMLGKPYNFTYVQNDASYYCSDFIERAFRTAHVFALEPMNFKNPQTGVISQYWIDFYRSKGMDVPQGQPGTNPNDMARSNALHLVGRLS